ncbi:hypothetical protein [Stenotrophomonas sp. SORGH_AS_0321]|uniref:hypothetical protein n=1 Tax=Stenotrophomonas sp. SORGH_AS_0321 TaxID=3041787 RepID=UPI00286BCB84|nr:hypothetical protein [Stenotrophomonas sp. SORGH_AS_0321]
MLASFMDGLMIRATDPAVSIPLQAIAVTRPLGAAETGALLPVRLGNTALPGAADGVAPAAIGTVSWRRILVAVGTLAALGSVAYWTFGQPVFTVGSRANVPAPTPEPGGAGRVVDWAALDRILRQSFG